MMPLIVVSIDPAIRSLQLKALAHPIRYDIYELVDTQAYTVSRTSRD